SRRSWRSRRSRAPTRAARSASARPSSPTSCAPGKEYSPLPLTAAPCSGFMSHPQGRECDMAVDEAKLNEFMGKAVGDLGAAMSAVLVVIGDKLGLYKALAEAGPST